MDVKENLINWEAVAKDVEIAAASFSKRTGYDLSCCESAAWEGIAKAYARYDPSRGIPFWGYYNRAIFGALYLDYRRFRTAVNRPNNRTTDGAEELLSVSLDTLLDLADEPQAESFDVETYEELAPILATLDERERAIVDAHYIEDKPFRQIGSELGITGSRVQQILASAIQKVRQRYQERAIIDN